jgi:hypothetical protein
MRDPRIERLLLKIDETTARGGPTRSAELASKTKDLLVEIEKLRSEIEVASRQVVALSAREAALRKALTTRTGRRAATLVSGSNALKLDNITEFTAADDPDVEYQQERLETVVANLKARRNFIQRTQDLLAARISTVQKLLDMFTRIEEAPAAGSRPKRRLRRVRRRR